MSDDRIHLTLFVAGKGPAAKRAIAVLKTLCDGELVNECSLEVVDLLEQPDKAREYKILSIPTLIKKSTLQEQRFVGDLSDKDELRSALIGS